MGNNILPVCKYVQFPERNVGNFFLTIPGYDIDTEGNIKFRSKPYVGERKLSNPLIPNCMFGEFFVIKNTDPISLCLSSRWRQG